MNLRSYILSLLFLSISAIGIAQDYKAAIESEFTEYLNLLVNLEFDKSMDYIMPEIFEFLPREQMVKLMEDAFSNTDVEIEMTNPEILKIDDAQNIDGKFYTLLTYSNQMNVKIFDDEDEVEGEEQQMIINLIKGSFEESVGSGNVNYNEETRFFEILSQKDVFAVSEDGHSNWKFIEIEEEKKFILEKILPKELMEKM